MDPEVEEQLAQEATVVRPFGEQSGKVRPPCGYGLLQAKEEARKVQALQSIMRVRRKYLRFISVWEFFFPDVTLFFSFFAAVCVAAVISVAGADGELPGCN